MPILNYFDKINDTNNKESCLAENKYKEYYDNIFKDPLHHFQNFHGFKDGLYDVREDCKIILKRMEVLEHGELKKEVVSGIVLHQTNGETAMSTLTRYHADDLGNKIVSSIFGKQAKDGIGAHFLISPSGMIYQTARIDKICYHVGPYINSLCQRKNFCEKNQTDLYKNIMSDSKLDEKGKWKAITDIEKNKPGHERYPKNDDSIGIETVGMPPDGVNYPRASAEQITSIKWLLKLLLQYFNLKDDRVFAHGEISPHKQSSEGVHITAEIRGGIAEKQKLIR